MECRRARAAVSERMDGERLAPRMTATVDRHLEACRECAAFTAAA